MTEKRIRNEYVVTGERMQERVVCISKDTKTGQNRKMHSLAEGVNKRHRDLSWTPTALAKNEKKTTRRLQA